MINKSPWPLTIATYNIHSAIGRDGRFDPTRIGTVITELQADVIALQEVPLGGTNAPNVLDVLQAQTGYYSAAGPTMEGREGSYGNGVLSRFPILAIRSIDLSYGRREPRGALDADLDCHGCRLRVVATHLGLRPAERRRQIRSLLQAFDTSVMPVILLGDINEWLVWGRPLRWLTSHFQRTPAPPTFPSQYPVFALDRIWIRPRQRLLHVKVHRTPLARIASDHLPLVAHIGE